MHNENGNSSIAGMLYKLVNSPVIHVLISLGALQVLANVQGETNLQEMLMAALGLVVLGVAASGFFRKDDGQLSKRFYLTLYFAWLAALVFSEHAIDNPLAISLVVMTFIAPFIDRNSNLIAGLGIVLAFQLGWIQQSDVYFVSDLTSPLVNIIIILGYSLLLFRVLEPSADKQDKVKSPHADERKKLVALVNSMGDGVIATDQNQKVTIYNGAALSILNLNVSLESQDLQKYLKLVDQKGEPVDIFDLAHKSRTNYVSRDLRLQLDDDQPINLYISVAPVRVGYGQQSTLGYIFLLRDITKEKSLEEERDEFISVVSHELRTPITVTEGSISNAQLVLNKKDGDKKAVEASLEEAHKSALFLADMINDLSMLSRAERGKLQVEPESVDIVSMLNDFQEDYKIEAKQKGLKIIVPEHPKIKPVNTSPLYAKEILQNFITNSIKYTDKGSITLTAKHTDKGVDVSVKDTGIGISKSDQKKLFDKFFRSEDYRTRQSSGTGLGLYVTMKLAHLIGATINVESKLNKGSEFIISIPNLEAHHHQKN